MNAIELHDISKAFGTHLAVNNLSLRVPEGTVYGFIGPNGSGKTTTLRMIMNIIMPDSGSIHVLGSPATSSCSDRVGYMPEERGLYKRMKVRELLVFLGRLKSENGIRSKVDRWLETMDLTSWADKKVETLSKGMAQKVQFIATVVSEPDLVLLDEPFTGLDPVNTDVLKDAILGLRSRGTTVIFSTHDMSMAERMCDFIFMIYRGRKVLDGTLEEIQGTYGHDTIRVKVHGGAAALDGLQGVERVNDFGQVQELRLSSHGDAQRVLRQILDRTSIQTFDIVKPSLHDIFVRIAGPEAKEVAHA